MSTRLTPGKRGNIQINQDGHDDFLWLGATDALRLVNQLLWHYLENGPPAARERALGVVNFHAARERAVATRAERTKVSA